MVNDLLPRVNLSLSQLPSGFLRNFEIKLRIDIYSESLKKVVAYFFLGKILLQTFSQTCKVITKLVFFLGAALVKRLV